MATARGRQPQTGMDRSLPLDQLVRNYRRSSPRLVSQPLESVVVGAECIVLQCAWQP